MGGLPLLILALSWAFIAGAFVGATAQYGRDRQTAPAGENQKCP